MEFRQTLDLPTIMYAANAARTAQLAYGRAYFEFRHEPMTTTEALALLRLLYGQIQNSLEHKLLQAGTELPEPDEHCGPFASDPRATIFDIDAHLTQSYLAKCDQEMAQFLQQNKVALGLNADELNKWTQELERLRQFFGSPVNSNETASNQKSNTNQQSNLPLAQCG